MVSTGYNGAAPGQRGCLAGACPRGLLSYEEVAELSDYENGPGRCIAVHAEANCVVYGDYDKMRGATIYITGAPCSACRKLIAAAGITTIVYPGSESSE